MKPFPPVGRDLRFLSSFIGRLLVVLLGLSAGLRAAEVKGRVVDPQGFAVNEVRVHLRTGPSVNTEPVLLRTALTDVEGRFAFSNLPAGEYQVEVVAAGFQAGILDVRRDSEHEELLVRLKLAGLHQGVLVTANREETDTFDAPLSAAVVDQKRLDRLMPLNLAQALEEIPGVTWINAGAFRARPVIRGLASNRILVLVDGERLNHGRTSTSDAGIETSLLDLPLIDQAEVVLGPGSVLYGSDAFGGVLNIRTRSTPFSEKAYFGARVRNDYFSNGGSRRTSVDLVGGNRWLSARIGGSVNDINNYDSPNGTVHGSGVDENGASGEIRFTPARQQAFYARFLHHGAYRFGLPSLDPNPVFLAFFPFSKLRKFSGGYEGTFNRPAFSNLQARFYKQEQGRDFSNLLTLPGSALFSETVTDVSSFGLDVQATSVVAKRHVLTYGASYNRDTNRDQRVQILNPATSNVVLSRAPSVPNSSLSGLGFFLHDQYQATGRLRLTAGIRYDHFALDVSPTPNFDLRAQGVIGANRSDNAVSGNVGAVVEFNSGWVATTHVARAFREPNLFERFFFGRGSVGGFVVPNPNLQPETSVQFDVGTRVRRGPVRFSVNYFLNRLSDLIVTGPGSFNGQSVISGQPVRQNFNLGRSRIQGIESSAELIFNRLGSQWNPFLTLAWQRGSDLANNQPLPLIAPFISHVGLRWQPARVRLWSEWTARIVKGSNRVPLGFDPLSGFTTFSLRLGYELARMENGIGVRLPRGLQSVNLHLGLENLSNHSYRGLFESAPEPGRGVRFGVNFNLGTAGR